MLQKIKSNMTVERLENSLLKFDLIFCTWWTIDFSLFDFIDKKISVGCDVRKRISLKISIIVIIISVVIVFVAVAWLCCCFCCSLGYLLQGRVQVPLLALHDFYDEVIFENIFEIVPEIKVVTVTAVMSRTTVFLHLGRNPCPVTTTEVFVMWRCCELLRIVLPILFGSSHF